MRSDLPQLSALLSFETVARRLSFARAADELNLTPSAVSHQIANLEQFLGVLLFERSSRGIVLSDAGEAYLKRVAGAIGAIGNATNDVRKGVRNTLHVHSSPSFASLWLMPRLSGFARTYPDVALSRAARLGAKSCSACRRSARNASSSFSLRAKATIAKRSGSRSCAAKLNSAGINLRRVRSPVAPNSTSAHGSGRGVVMMSAQGWSGVIVSP